MKAQVLLPKVFNFPFTYNSKKESKIGDLVEVPFGSKNEIGVIWKNKYSEPINIKIKDIKENTGYRINSKLIDFIEWFSSYNLVPIGLVLKMVIGGTNKFIKKKDELTNFKKTKKKNFKLNKEQLIALDFLENINDKFDVSVLQGTTGSGKTHLAIETMLSFDNGMIGFPLRLLAREVFDKISLRCGKQYVALITGEERIMPENPKYWVCTVEAMPINLTFDFVAIDEIQLCADLDRGHIFTNRLLNLRGKKETIFLGSSSIKKIINNILPDVEFLSERGYHNLNM